MKRTTQLSCRTFEIIFGGQFLRTEGTRLVGWDGEPFYAAKNAKRVFAEIRYVKDSLPSALHEVAHWCVAGYERRKQDDYGYWYNPDGRSADEQRTFESLEVKPQAMEWLLSVAAGRPFVVSCDNLRGQPYDLEAFRRRIKDQAVAYLSKPAPKRFNILLRKVLEYQQSHPAWDCYWSKVLAEGLLPDT